MDLNRPADESDVLVVGEIIRTGARKDVLDFVPHSSEIIAQRKNMVVDAARMRVIIGGDLHYLHMTLAHSSGIENHPFFWRSFSMELTQFHESTEVSSLPRR